MFVLQQQDTADKPELYRQLVKQAEALFHGEPDFIANSANLSSLLFHSLPDLNWVGVYRNLGGQLVLGPFQGNPACLRIAMGRGVCGTAAQQRETVLVPDVHQFPGHIACDGASQSEIVVPILRGETLLGVLDLDSPSLRRFDLEDQAGLEELAKLLAQSG